MFTRFHRLRRDVEHAGANQKGTITSQGSAIAVNPVNGNVYVAWASVCVHGSVQRDHGSANPRMRENFGAPSADFNFPAIRSEHHGHLVPYQRVILRSRTDMFGFVYVAFSAKGLGLVATPASSPRAPSTDAPGHQRSWWTSEAKFGDHPSGRGHQIMPAITFANGRLTILVLRSALRSLRQLSILLARPLELILPC